MSQMMRRFWISLRNSDTSWYNGVKADDIAVSFLAFRIKKIWPSEDGGCNVGRSMTDINTRCGGIISDNIRTEGEPSAEATVGTQSFPEFSPFAFIPSHVGKNIARIFSLTARLPSRDTHWSAISCGRRKPWEWGRQSGRRQKQKRAYRNPRGVGPDENQGSQLSQPTTEKR